CSGCSLNAALDCPPIIGEAEEFFESRRVTGFKLHTADVVEWRCRAKLAVRGTAERPLVGLYAARSHDVVDIPMCRAHHPRLNAAAAVVRSVINDMGIEPYDEETGQGMLRYIQLALTTNDTSIPAAERYLKGKVQLTLVWNSSNEKSPLAEKLPALCRELWRRGGAEDRVLHSVWVNFQTSSSNVIFGGRWRHMIGPTDMWERLGGVDVCFTPGSFGQANYKAFDAMLKHLHSLIPRRSSVVELYAGAGAIGLSLAATTQCNVRCYEINEAARAPFTRSLERLQPLLRHPAAVAWHQADAEAPVESHLDILLDADVVLVDPPRRGLHEPVMAALLHAARYAGRLSQQHSDSQDSSIARSERRRDGSSGSSGGRAANGLTLVYISCGWDAFQRDCDKLTQDGLFHLSHASAFNFFPGTNSIETLAIFTTAKPHA
ncbi:hypothetical protein CLOP_g812, partial [Closterium sp. NIES-67]